LLKAIAFPKTHSITTLLKLLEQAGINIPDDLYESVILTEYAVTMRYPGEYKPVTEEEYNEALLIAQKVLDFVAVKFNQNSIFL
jgi:HEPN domain-containing protein